MLRKRSTYDALITIERAYHPFTRLISFRGSQVIDSGTKEDLLVLREYLWLRHAHPSINIPALSKRDNSRNAYPATTMRTRVSSQLASRAHRE